MGGKLYLNTGDCAYCREPGAKPCGHRPRWLHLPTKKPYCQVHFQRVKPCHYPWVNMERKDVQQVIDTYDARHPQPQQKAA
jgi:hypothetical protein